MLKINNKKGEHTLNAVRDGDWIIYTCPLCPEYEMRDNWRTGEIKTKGLNEFSHSGCYFPDEYEDAFTNTN